jgi:hypothetical protein
MKYVALMKVPRGMHAILIAELRGKRPLHIFTLKWEDNLTLSML